MGFQRLRWPEACAALEEMNTFKADIEEIRRRALDKMEQGAVTAFYKADREKVIEVLNEVLATETLGAFVRIFLRAPGAKISAGDKIQVFFPDVGTRTYSPYAADPSGRFELAVFLHDRGPSSAWARGLRAGERVKLVGPQGSLALAAIAGPLALFGDETSFGVARSLLALRPDAQLRFETGAGCEPIVTALELPAEALRPRGDLARIAKELASLGGTLVLTGNARSIQTLRGHLKQLGSTQLQRVKSYWAEGKTGLD